MHDQHQLHQQMLELAYDLLPAEEAAALQARIDADPELAQQYAAVGEQVALLGRAARLETPPVVLTRPAKRAKVSAGDASATRGRAMRVVHWTAAIAASVLLLIVAAQHWRANRQRAAIAHNHVQMVLTGTQFVSPEAGGVYHLAARTAAGDPITTDVEYALYAPSGAKLLGERGRTDSEGRLAIEVPPGVDVPRGARLEVLAAGGDAVARLQLPLTATGPKYATYLSLDKPLYQPGETMYYRSLTLSRFSLHSDIEAPIRFEILDPSGAVVADSQVEGVTLHGVGNGSFAIAGHLPGGQYTLVAKSVDGLFPEERREFFVRRYRLPRLKKELEFVRDSYAPGDRVVADFAATRAEGGAAAGATLRITAVVDDQTVHQATTQAASDGSFQMQFDLPKKMDKGAGQLVVVVDDGGNQETMAKTIPINLGKVDVEFFPEGGDLIAGVENRVYFTGRDPVGEPVHIEGEIRNSADKVVAAIETGHEGMGRFAFKPKKNETYTLAITSPAGVASKPALPAVGKRRIAVLSAGPGVFAAEKPVDIVVESVKANAELVVAAYCRGIQTGQQMVPAGKGQHKLSLDLAKEIAGVVRLTLFDYSSGRPRPIAERLVYRMPQQKLTVRLADHSERYSPGEAVGLSLVVVDESGKPTPAVLGVSVVDDALLSLADDKSPQLPAHFYLTTEIEKPEDLEDANFYLSDDPEAPASLDLLLGTQGWRRFAEMTLVELQKEGKDDEEITRLAALGGIAPPPSRMDNGQRARTEYAASLAVFDRQRAESQRSWGLALVAVAGALGLLLVMLSLFRSSGRGWSPLPALALTAGCLLVGVFALRVEVPDDALAIARAEKLQQPLSNRRTAEETATEPAEAPAAYFDRYQWDVSDYSGLLFGDMPLADDKDWYDHDRFANGYLHLGVAPANAAGGEPWGLLAGEGDWKARGWAMDQKELRKRQHELRDLDGAVALEEAPFDNARRQAGGFAGGDRWWHAAGGKQNLEARQELLSRLDRVENLKDLQKYRDFGNQLRAAGDEEFAKKLEEKLAQLRFPVRQYAHVHSAGQPGVRSDFTETLYWNPLLVTDEDGRAEIKFDLSDSVTTFRVAVDAHSQQGRVGAGGGEIISRIPFSIEPKLPLEVTAGDRIDLPVAVVNDTRDVLPVELAIKYGDLVQLTGEGARKLSLPSEARLREYYQLAVVGQQGEVEFEWSGQATTAAGGVLTDAVQKTLQVVSSGFPIARSFAGRIAGEQEVTVELPDDVIEGSLLVSLHAFPSALADLEGGVAGILREPSGCFEQTSTSNYPNVMSLTYMQEEGVADPALTRRARELMKKGYGRLTGYECPTKGYEWFGGNPGHEALTAYGLMQFRDMAEVYDVDQEMIDRTAQWLLARRDGRGGFQRNAKALDSFGRASQEITDAYIVWALSEAGQQDIDKELAHVVALGEKSDDPYLVALAAASAANAKDAAASKRLLEKLTKLQQDDGHLVGTDGSITRSGGKSLEVETTALAALAWLNSPAFRSQADRAVEWITANRQGSGSFGSTQATILALKALVTHAQAGSAKVTGGELILKRDGEQVATQTFTAGERNRITLEGVAAYLERGENKLSVSLSGDNEMPFAIEVSYRTPKLESSEECPVRLTTKLGAAKVETGQTVPLTAVLKNATDKGQPMTVAILGLPAGLEARTEQLEELKKAGVIDYYETRAREVICYWRALAPNREVEVRLDLVAEIGGQYTGPASRAYLYYTDEHKQWCDPLKVEIVGRAE